MITILTNSNNGQFGSADFWMEERDKEMKGRLMFKIVGRQLEVLDPFGGQDQHAFEVLSSLLRSELERKGLLP